MHINTDSYNHVSYLPEDEKKIQGEILEHEKEAVQVINAASSLVVKIRSLESKISDLGEEIKRSKTRAPHERVGWGCAGVGAVLLCPFSWAAGICVSFAAVFGGAGGPAFSIAIDLFKKPVELCGTLFKRAINAERIWQKEIEETQGEIQSTKQKLIRFVEKEDPVIKKIENEQKKITVIPMQQDADKILANWKIVKERAISL